jgi:polyisoprenoid-binding protein YceI
MAPSGQLTSTTLLKSLRDGRFVGRWVLDGARTEVLFKSRYMWGLVPLKGTFHHVRGHAIVSEASDVTGTISVGAASVDTGNKTRDERLRSADFFDAANYPDICFSIEGATPFGWGMSGWGRLTVRGKTSPLFFDAAVSSGDGETSVDGDFEINRADFGLGWNQMRMASMQSTITAHLVFTHQ